MKGRLPLAVASLFVRAAMQMSGATHVGFSYDGDEMHVVQLATFGEIDYERALYLQERPYPLNAKEDAAGKPLGDPRSPRWP